MGLKVTVRVLESRNAMNPLPIGQSRDNHGTFKGPDHVIHMYLFVCTMYVYKIIIILYIYIQINMPLFP